ncbi:class F sortase [Streptomyces sp. NPDC101160]|uniref:class F sortase n=1 Tax=Streptomyces sp. NPDC101160 TaxID=3366118 RepID=UPI0037FFC363
MRNGFTRTTTGRPPRRVPSVKTLAWTALAGTLLLTHALHLDGPSRPTAAQAGPSAARTGVRAGPDGPAPLPLPAADPTRVRIPAIGVDAPLTPLGLDGTGALRPPPATSPTVAGWYADGTTPGAPGTAVVAGHVDTPMGPAVFHRLGTVSRGTEIAVDREDGRTALFTVDKVEVHPKDGFPDDQVYGSSGRPELRLITCGGDWSESTGYEANTVVYATLTGTR